jgi:Carbohydrate binding domain (family 11)
MQSNRKWATSLGIAALAAWGLSAQTTQAQAPDTVNYILSNFESGIGSTPHNGYWFDFTDNNSVSAEDTALFGNSRITSVDSFGQPFVDSNWNYLPASYPVGREGVAGTLSKRMGFAFGDRRLSCGTDCSYDPYVGWGLNFTTLFVHAPHNNFDLTGATAISFWAKSDSDTVTFNFSVIIKDTVITNTADYAQTIKVGPEWKKYTVELKASAELAQPTWATPKPFNLQMVTGIGFGFNRGQNVTRPTNGISIDDIIIENWQYVAPPEPEPEPEPEPISIKQGLRAMTLRGKAPMQNHGPRVHFVTPDGRKLPLDASGRILPAR